MTAIKAAAVAAAHAASNRVYVRFWAANAVASGPTQEIADEAMSAAISAALRRIAGDFQKASE